MHPSQHFKSISTPVLLVGVIAAWMIIHGLYDVSNTYIGAVFIVTGIIALSISFHALMEDVGWDNTLLVLGIACIGGALFALATAIPPTGTSVHLGGLVIAAILLIVAKLMIRRWSSANAEEDAADGDVVVLVIDEHFIISRY